MITSIFLFMCDQMEALRAPLTPGNRGELVGKETDLKVLAPHYQPNSIMPHHPMNSHHQWICNSYTFKLSSWIQ